VIGHKIHVEVWKFQCEMKKMMKIMAFKKKLNEKLLYEKKFNASYS
jgi:hypothetical protein